LAVAGARHIIGPVLLTASSLLGGVTRAWAAPNSAAHIESHTYLTVPATWLVVVRWKTVAFHDPTRKRVARWRPIKPRHGFDTRTVLFLHHSLAHPPCHQTRDCRRALVASLCPPKVAFGDEGSHARPPEAHGVQARHQLPRPHYHQIHPYLHDSLDFVSGQRGEIVT
jgi:hypothetical protein